MRASTSRSVSPGDSVSMTSNEIQKRALEMRRPPEAAFLMVAEEKDEAMRFGNFRGGNLVQNFEEYLKNIFDPLFEVCLRFSQAELCVLCQKIREGFLILSKVNSRSVLILEFLRPFVAKKQEQLLESMLTLSVAVCVFVCTGGRVG